ncbi:MAG: hypothetical protein Q9195_006863, partial [Heterodermia aff. obscurata]
MALPLPSILLTLPSLLPSLYTLTPTPTLLPPSSAPLCAIPPTSLNLTRSASLTALSAADCGTCLSVCVSEPWQCLDVLLVDAINPPPNDPPNTITTTINGEVVQLHTDDVPNLNSGVEIRISEKSGLRSSGKGA